MYVSLPTLDERVWRTTEPGTAPPASRLRAVRALADAGIDVGIGMAPILPGLSDRARAARGRRPRSPRSGRAGHLGERRPPAARVSASTSSRRSHSDWPEQVERYEALFATRAYLPTVGHERDHRAGARGTGLDRLSEHAGRPARPQPRQLSLSI